MNPGHRLTSSSLFLWVIPLLCVLLVLPAAPACSADSPSIDEESVAKPGQAYPAVAGEGGIQRSYLATSLMIPMRDGVRLAANLIMPGDGKPSPVVVSITPYNRHDGHRLGATYAKSGLAFLGVDVRGRGDSEGEFKNHFSDLNDTVDVIAWVAKQRWSNGKIGMWGSSYGGYNQWMAAAKQAKELTTITPGASAYPGWDFPMANYVGYPYTSKWAAFTKGRANNRMLFEDPVFWNEAFLDALAQGIAFKDLDEFVGFDTDIFDEWVAHPGYDEYWASINPTREEMQAIELPILSTTGLYDGAQLGELRYYKEHMALASEEAKARHFLVIGPYDHSGVVFPRPSVGGLDVPDSGGFQSTELHRQWFAWTMEGGARPEFLRDQVMYYVMGEGANDWRSAPSLEAIPVQWTKYALSWRDQPPVSVKQAGLLSAQHTGPATASYVFDPLDISKARLGNWYEGDFAIYDADVLALDGEGLVFETEPFDTAVELIGQPRFEAYIGIDTPDADFRMRIYEVRPDNTSVYLSEMRARARYRETVASEQLIESDQPLLYRFPEFRFASRRMQVGSKLRFVFEAPNSIHIQRNYNSGKPVAEQTPADAMTSTVTMVLGGNNASSLYLPLRTLKAD